MAATIGVDCKSLIKQLIETITTDRESERLLLNLTPTTDGHPAEQNIARGFPGASGVFGTRR